MALAERRRLTAVARGEAAADLFLRGGTLLNVYTGALHPAHVAVAGGRVAYVGSRDDMVGPRTRVLEVAGRLLVPGYIDPRASGAPRHALGARSPRAAARHHDGLRRHAADLGARGPEGLPRHG